MKKFSHFCLSFLPVLSLFTPFFPLHNFPQVFPFYQLITINNDLHLRLIQTLCLYSSRSTPLRKTPTVDHHPRIERFQQSPTVYRRSLLSLTIPGLHNPLPSPIVLCCPLPSPIILPTLNTHVSPGMARWAPGWLSALASSVTPQRYPPVTQEARADV